MRYNQRRGSALLLVLLIMTLVTVAMRPFLHMTTLLFEYALSRTALYQARWSTRAAMSWAILYAQKQWLELQERAQEQQINLAHWPVNNEKNEHMLITLKPDTNVIFITAQLIGGENQQLSSCSVMLRTTDQDGISRYYTTNWQEA